MAYYAGTEAGLLTCAGACMRPQDNTLTEPYSLEAAPQLAPSLGACREAVQGRLVLLSNSVCCRKSTPTVAPSQQSCIT